MSQTLDELKTDLARTLYLIGYREVEKQKIERDLKVLHEQARDLDNKIATAQVAGEPK